MTTTDPIDHADSPATSPEDGHVIGADRGLRVFRSAHGCHGARGFDAFPGFGL